MPFVAHNKEWILGYGETAEEAGDRMRRDYPDLEPVVEPATRALVNSLEGCPLADSRNGKLYMEVNHVGPSVDGVEVLPEEFQVLRQQKDLYGFSHRKVRAEVDMLRKWASAQ